MKKILVALTMAMALISCGTKEEVKEEAPAVVEQQAEATTTETTTEATAEEATTEEAAPADAPAEEATTTEASSN